MYLVYCMKTREHMFVLKMYVQIMSLSVLLWNVCVCYVYIIKMSKKNKSKQNKSNSKGLKSIGKSAKIPICEGR